MEFINAFFLPVTFLVGLCIGLLFSYLSHPGKYTDMEIRPRAGKARQSETSKKDTDMEAEYFSISESLKEYTGMS